MGAGNKTQEMTHRIYAYQYNTMYSPACHHFVDNFFILSRCTYVISQKNDENGLPALLNPLFPHRRQKVIHTFHTLIHKLFTGWMIGMKRHGYRIYKAIYTVRVHLFLKVIHNFTIPLPQNKALRAHKMGISVLRRNSSWISLSKM